MTLFLKQRLKLHMQVEKIIVSLRYGEDPSQFLKFAIKARPTRLPPWEELEVREDGLHRKYKIGRPQDFERTREFFAYALSNDAPVRMDPRLAHLFGECQLPAPMLPVALEEVRAMGLDIDSGRVLEHDLFMIYSAVRDYTNRHNRVHPVVLEYMRDSFYTLICQKLWHRSQHTNKELLDSIVVTVRDANAPQPRRAPPLSGSAPA